MARYWISWVQRTEDHRPLTFPPREAILGWWCSGYDSEDNAILCAAVEAERPELASIAIFTDWPEAKKEMVANGWRVFQHNKGNDWRPGDRFPLSDWMEERFNSTSVVKP